MSNIFFDERSEESAVKARIVDKYYRAWAKIMQKRSDKIAYIDLFSGPGCYKNGEESVPLLVLRNAISDPILRNSLVTVFNDKNIKYCLKLSDNINKLPEIQKLKYQPIIKNEIVGKNIIDNLVDFSLIPSLSFIDPWGYKGLSLSLISGFIKNWGCDCIFFFNYNRINMGLNNAGVRQHMISLFGEKGFSELLDEILIVNNENKEIMVIEKISQSIKKIINCYILPFCFRNESGKRTSHYLIFVSKHIRGYNIMKDIMGKESSDLQQGVPSFDYCKADVTTPLLFDFARPLDELENILLKDFSGKTLKMIDIFNMHHIGKRYVINNYKDALKSLESKEKIKVNPCSKKRRKNTFSEKTMVTFY